MHPEAYCLQKGDSQSWPKPRVARLVNRIKKLSQSSPKKGLMEQQLRGTDVQPLTKIFIRKNQS